MRTIWARICTSREKQHERIELLQLREKSKLFTLVTIARFAQPEVESLVKTSYLHTCLVGSLHRRDI